MKLLYSFFFIFLISLSSFSQDNKDIAEIYFKRAGKSYAEKDLIKTERYLNKAVEYFGGYSKSRCGYFWS